MIAEDRIETVGAGIDAVMDHMIVTVVTVSNFTFVDQMTQMLTAPNITIVGDVGEKYQQDLHDADDCPCGRAPTNPTTIFM